MTASWLVWDALKDTLGCFEGCSRMLWRNQKDALGCFGGPLGCFKDWVLTPPWPKATWDSLGLWYFYCLLRHPGCFGCLRSQPPFSWWTMTKPPNNTTSLPPIHPHITTATATHFDTHTCHITTHFDHPNHHITPQFDAHSCYVTTSAYLSNNAHLNHHLCHVTTEG